MTTVNTANASPKPTATAAHAAAAPFQLPHLTVDTWVAIVLGVAALIVALISLMYARRGTVVAEESLRSETAGPVLEFAHNICALAVSREPAEFQSDIEIVLKNDGATTEGAYVDLLFEEPFPPALPRLRVDNTRLTPTWHREETKMLPNGMEHRYTAYFRQHIPAGGHPIRMGTFPVVLSSAPATYEFYYRVRALDGSQFPVEGEGIYTFSVTSAG